MGGKAVAEWPKRPNHNNHKTHCGIETSPLKGETTLLFIKIKRFTSYRIWDTMVRTSIILFREEKGRSSKF